MIDSFALGNVIKKGIPIAIVGEPNVGKSTFLNALLNEDRAIVSHIAGTTRDTIEDEIIIGGINFRFIDTAGIRETKDEVETIGIKKTFEKITQAQVVIYLFDAGFVSQKESFLKNIISEIQKIKNKFPSKTILIVANKTDTLSTSQKSKIQEFIPDALMLSAKENIGIDVLHDKLLGFINTGALKNNDTIITNSRHYDALLKALEEIKKVQYGLNSGLSGDLLAIDIRQALYHFGEITGEITSDDLLGNIFANFCIGK